MTEDILVFGGLLLDHYISIDRLPERGQDGFITDERKFTGGCAVNMAVTAHNLTHHDAAPMRIHVISALGTDAAADEITAYMKKYNLSLDYTCPSEGATGSCMVFIEPNGERTFLTRKGIECQVAPALLHKIKKCRAKVVGVTGYSLLNECAGQIMDCISHLKDCGAKILFDPSPLVCDIAPAILSQIMAIADVITPNMTEMNALGDAKHILDYTAAGKTIILKKGSSGGTVYAPNETFSYDAASCHTIDTTGAGDSFAGALLYAMAKELPLHEAVALAIESAAKTVMIFGPHGFWT